MRKPKLIFKVDRNNRAKLYLNKKWVKDVTEISLHGIPFEYEVEIERYKRFKDGRMYITQDGLAREKKTYRIGEKCQQ